MTPGTTGFYFHRHFILDIGPGTFYNRNCAENAVPSACQRHEEGIRCES